MNPLYITQDELHQMFQSPNQTKRSADSIVTLEPQTVKFQQTFSNIQTNIEAIDQLKKELAAKDKLINDLNSRTSQQIESLLYQQEKLIQENLNLKKELNNSKAQQKHQQQKLELYMTETKTLQQLRLQERTRYQRDIRNIEKFNQSLTK
ncbi:unnamed protein product [Paramecium pentaurelia]|uniref:Uncharacterized protein n=1 Tax=Paramecium pentaurelia TaxID=43138 RepID=A0A8S1V189_9CILI|nr:unnamed protein product [Paramecium pentaurelia]